MLEVKDLTKKYNDILALDSVSLNIQKGEFFGLLGPNGAGKSTLMHLLVGYISPDSGKVTYDGDEITIHNISVRYKIGLVPQSIALYEDLSAEDNLKIFGSFYGLKGKQLTDIINENLNKVGLYERRKSIVKTFSGGMQRRLNIIAALLHSPDVLLCDEPTVGVDPQSRNAIFDFLQLINENGITIIYTTHYMEEAERMCKRIAIIDLGKIIASGTLAELLLLLPSSEKVSLAKSKDTAAFIEKIKSFGSVTESKEKYELKFNDDSKLSAFFSEVESSGINYNLLGFSKPTLEELFLKLTGRMLRD